MSIGQNIKQLRERFGLTQQQLGEIAGVTDKAVSSWEQDASSPRMGAIQRMADYFKIPKSAIIEGTPDPTAPSPEPEIQLMSRAMYAMTPEERAKLIEIGKVMFREAFRDDQKP